MDYWVIVSAVLAILGVLASVKWAQVKSLLKEVSEALVVLSAAIEDDKISREECEEIVNEFRDVIIAVMKLVGKVRK